MNKEKMKWKCHTPNLLQEVLQNPSAGMLAIPIQILGKLLGDVADRAAEINDPKLNAIMVRLTLYSVSDPDSEDYDAEVVDKVLNLGEARK